MTRNSAALAQDLSWLLRGAHCRDYVTYWAALETGYANATTRAAAHAHLRSSQAICRHCTVINECAQRAVIDRYTGLAAATAYLNGRPQTSRPDP